TTSSVSKGKKPYKSWLKDGVNGGMSSMDVLIHWLADKTNYSKWRGGDNNAERTPKKVLLEEIIERMRQVGIYHRLPKDVASKISTLQSNYRTAREWNDTEGKKLRQAGVKEEIVHEEIVKRFPYWDALHGSFGNFRTSPSWPMSISSIMDREEEEQQQQQLVGKNEHHHHQQQQQRHYRPQLHHHNTKSATSPPPIPIPTTRHASHPNPITTSTSPTTTNNNNNNNSDTNSNAIAQSSLSPPAPVQDDEDDEEQGDPSTATGKRYDSEELGESLLKVTREKEAGQLKRSHDMLEFQREKRLEREQLLIEQERTRRIRAKAELVKNLMEAGFTKQEIAEQL
ncbi:hypothetical protein BDA99DRAFT_417968, partial [Phascolomyces articulosus]